MIELRENQKEPIRKAIDFYREKSPKKHKGTPLKELPQNYMKWMLKEFTWDSKNKNLKLSIENALLSETL
jgi:hypothetical protein